LAFELLVSNDRVPFDLCSNHANNIIRCEANSSVSFCLRHNV